VACIHLQKIENVDIYAVMPEMDGRWESIGLYPP
jgi:hypothetical protein